MLPQEPPRKSLAFYKNNLFKKLNCKYDQAQDKNQQTDAVDPMHVLYKIRFGTVGIRLFEV